MNLQQALARIEELERKVAELEKRPQQQIHYHTHTQERIYGPAVPQYPAYPQYPWTSPWCSGLGGVGIGYPSNG